MQTQAAEDLRKLVTAALVDRGLVYEGAASFATPRRLALHIAGLPVRQPTSARRKKAARSARRCGDSGFLKGRPRLAGAGDDPERPKKGEFYIA